MSTAGPTAAAIACGFHDAECARYRADLPLWLSLAETARGPIIDVGAGTGRVALALAAGGHDVTAVDLDGDLLDELARRADREGLAIRTVVGDARSFDPALDSSGTRDAALVIVPMQTIQLLTGAAARVEAFHAAAAASASTAELVLSVVLEVEPFDGRGAVPALLAPDVAEAGGFRFESTPLAVLQDTPNAPVDMHRRRVVRDLDGAAVGAPQDVVITLAPVTVTGLQEEAELAGWVAREVVAMAPTGEHAGATILTFAKDGAA